MAGLNLIRYYLVLKLSNKMQKNLFLKKKYIKNIFEKFKMNKSKFVNSSIETCLKFVNSSPLCLIGIKSNQILSMVSPNQEIYEEFNRNSSPSDKKDLSLYE